MGISRGEIAVQLAPIEVRRVLVAGGKVLDGTAELYRGTTVGAVFVGDVIPHGVVAAGEDGSLSSGLA
jgi:hypothetical protein